MTGLNQETSEELQVVNYGIGGHYEPHYDFARVILTFLLYCANIIKPFFSQREETNAFKSLGTGNRIATVLFYVSN